MTRATEKGDPVTENYPMPPKKRLTVLLSDGIGPASKFSKVSRPLWRVSNSRSFDDGNTMFQVVLKRLQEIQWLSKETHCDLPDFYSDAVLEYDV